MPLNIFVNGLCSLSYNYFAIKRSSNSSKSAELRDGTHPSFEIWQHWRAKCQIWNGQVWHVQGWTDSERIVIQVLFVSPNKCQIWHIYISVAISANFNSTLHILKYCMHKHKNIINWKLQQQLIAYVTLISICNYSLYASCTNCWNQI